MEKIINKDIYGKYDLLDIGTILAEIATEITGIPMTMQLFYQPVFSKIDLMDYFTRANEVTLFYDIQVASIRGTSEGMFLGFPFASAPAAYDSDKDIEKEYWECYKRRRVLFSANCEPRKLTKEVQLANYNTELEDYCVDGFERADSKEIRKSCMRDCDPRGFVAKEGFIRDFLTFASKYRERNGLVQVSESTLRSIAQAFLESNKGKYDNYKTIIEEKRKLQKRESVIRIVKRPRHENGIHHCSF